MYTSVNPHSSKANGLLRPQPQRSALSIHSQRRTCQSSRPVTESTFLSLIFSVTLSFKVNRRNPRFKVGKSANENKNHARLECANSGDLLKNTTFNFRVSLKITFVTRTGESFSRKAEVRNRRRPNQSYVEDEF